MVETLSTEAGLVYAALILGGVCAIVALGVLVVVLLRSQREHNRQIQTLHALLKAKTLTEYAAAKQQLETSPRDRQREMQIENDLAKHAESITQRDQAWVSPQ
jgi:hypothetical protein